MNHVFYLLLFFFCIYLFLLYKSEIKFSLILSQLWEEERSITSSSTLLIINSKYKPTHMVYALDNAKAAKKRDIPHHSNQSSEILGPHLAVPIFHNPVSDSLPLRHYNGGSFPTKEASKGLIMHAASWDAMQWLIIRKFTWSTYGLIGDIKSFTNILIFFAHYICTSCNVF